MLGVIENQMKKLNEYTELYQQKTKEKEKLDKDKIS